jgi:hypothetical protein
MPLSRVIAILTTRLTIGFQDETLVEVIAPFKVCQRFLRGSLLRSLLSRSLTSSDNLSINLNHRDKYR